MGKNIQSISRLLRERPCPQLRNEPPFDSLELPSPNPFMASLWIGSGEGLAIKGFWDWGSRLSSGGSFWSSHNAHWACTGVSGGWGESSLQEFDHNHETKNQVFMQINDFWCSNRAPTSHQRPFYCFKDVNFPQKHPFFTFEAIQTL